MVSREDGFRDHGLCERCSSAPCLCASREALRAAATPDTVHILKHGRSYCRMFGVPGRWPPGHRWVSFEDNWEESATCDACRVGAGIGTGSIKPLIPLVLAEDFERVMNRINPTIERAERCLVLAGFRVAAEVPLSRDRVLRFAKHTNGWRLTVEPGANPLAATSRDTRVEALSRLPALVEELKSVTTHQLGTINTILIAANGLLDELDEDP